jgi:hypothetical protein
LDGRRTWRAVAGVALAAIAAAALPAAATAANRLQPPQLPRNFRGSGTWIVRDLGVTEHPCSPIPGVFTCAC